MIYTYHKTDRDKQRETREEKRGRQLGTDRETDGW